MVKHGGEGGGWHEEERMVRGDGDAGDGGRVSECCWCW